MMTNRWNKSSSKEQQAATTTARHSKFIPEADRGWSNGKAGPTSSSTASSSAASSTYSALTSIGGNLRPANFPTFSSLWSSPKGKSRELHGEAQKGADDETEEVMEEGEGVLSLRRRGHGRERSNSMPTSPTSDDTRSFFAAGREIDLDRNTSGSSRFKRKSLQMPPDAHILTSEEDDGGITPPLQDSPAALSRRNSLRSMSPPDMAPASSARTSRGYAWKVNAEGDITSSYIHPFHRNPTGKQAFYDTHFGSSAGWRSVAGMADDVFHPFDYAKQALGRWGVTSKKEKKEDDTHALGLLSLDKGTLARKKEAILNWKAINSLGVFGLSSTEMGGGKVDAKQGRNGEVEAVSRAYEPELIPKIHRHANAHQYFKNLSGNVVVLGGYRGSILRDAETNHMLWVPLKVGVGLRKATLELGLDLEAEERSEERVIADEMLGGIGNMVDMGKRLINRCSTKKTKVHSWGFDWRLSLARSSRRLEEFLLNLWMQSADEEADRRGAKVIAHSMGGLVALHALSQTNKPEIFSALVFASTPFLGTANILGPLRFGDAALLNDEICSPRATFSFRSSFYLLPVDFDEADQTNTRGGRCFEEEDGTPHDLDFLDPETWNDIGFSPCVERGMRKECLQRSQKRAAREGRTLMQSLERSASIREERGISNQESNVSMQAAFVPTTSVPGPGMSLQEGEKVHATQKNHIDGQNGSELSQQEIDDVLEDEATAAWLYLEDTLAQTRQFWNDLRTSFKEDFFEQDRYPPMSILTSGRTPTVRGALVAEKKAGNIDQDWKEGAREGNYSRMIYAPGDGVILKRSSTTLPGQWGKLLVRAASNHDKETLTDIDGVVED